MKNGEVFDMNIECNLLFNLLKKTNYKMEQNEYHQNMVMIYVDNSTIDLKQYATLSQTQFNSKS